jgi:hypothetical protein
VGYNHTTALNAPPAPQALDHVDFVIRFDRESGALAAVSVAKRPVPSAPPPGSLVVVPACHDARDALRAAERTMADVDDDTDRLRVVQRRIREAERPPSEVP